MITRPRNLNPIALQKPSLQTSKREAKEGEIFPPGTIICTKYPKGVFAQEVGDQEVAKQFEKQFLHVLTQFQEAKGISTQATKSSIDAFKSKIFHEDYSGSQAPSFFEGMRARFIRLLLIFKDEHIDQEKRKNYLNEMCKHLPFCASGVDKRLKNFEIEITKLPELTYWFADICTKISQAEAAKTYHSLFEAKDKTKKQNNSVHVTNAFDYFLQNRGVPLTYLAEEDTLAHTMGLVYEDKPINGIIGKKIFDSLLESFIEQYQFVPIRQALHDRLLACFDEAFVEGGYITQEQNIAGLTNQTFSLLDVVQFKHGRLIEKITRFLELNKTWLKNIELTGTKGEEGFERSIIQYNEDMTDFKLNPNILSIIIRLMFDYVFTPNIFNVPGQFQHVELVPAIWVNPPRVEDAKEAPKAFDYSGWEQVPEEEFEDRILSIIHSLVDPKYIVSLFQNLPQDRFFRFLELREWYIFSTKITNSQYRAIAEPYLQDETRKKQIAREEEARRIRQEKSARKKAQEEALKTAAEQEAKRKAVEEAKNQAQEQEIKRQDASAVGKHKNLKLIPPHYILAGEPEEKIDYDAWYEVEDAVFEEKLHRILLAIINKKEHIGIFINSIPPQKLKSIKDTHTFVNSLSTLTIAAKSKIRTAIAKCKSASAESPEPQLPEYMKAALDSARFCGQALVPSFWIFEGEPADLQFDFVRIWAQIPNEILIDKLRNVINLLANPEHIGTLFNQLPQDKWNYLFSIKDRIFGSEDIFKFIVTDAYKDIAKETVQKKFGEMGKEFKAAKRESPEPKLPEALPEIKSTGALVHSLLSRGKTLPVSDEKKSININWAVMAPTIDHLNLLIKRGIVTTISDYNGHIVKFSKKIDCESVVKQLLAAGLKQVEDFDVLTPSVGEEYMLTFKHKLKITQDDKLMFVPASDECLFFFINSAIPSLKNGVTIYLPRPKMRNAALQALKDADLTEPRDFTVNDGLFTLQGTLADKVRLNMLLMQSELYRFDGQSAANCLLSIGDEYHGEITANLKKLGYNFKTTDKPLEIIGAFPDDAFFMSDLISQGKIYLFDKKPNKLYLVFDKHQEVLFQKILIRLKQKSSKLAEGVDECKDFRVTKINDQPALQIATRLLLSFLSRQDMSEFKHKPGKKIYHLVSDEFVNTLFNLLKGKVPNMDFAIGLPHLIPGPEIMYSPVGEKLEESQPLVKQNAKYLSLFITQGFCSYDTYQNWSHELRQFLSFKQNEATLIAALEELERRILSKGESADRLSDCLNAMVTYINDALQNGRAIDLGELTRYMLQSNAEGARQVIEKRVS